MKMIFCLCLMLFCMHTNHAQLKLEIHGIKIAEGNIYIGIYNKAEGFTQIEKTYKYRIIPAANHRMVIEINDLPNGKYALSLFHDRNSNGILDKNRLGIPKEIYGFSNDARKMFSAPSFEECTFTYKDNLQISVVLR